MGSSLQGPDWYVAVCAAEAVYADHVLGFAISGGVDSMALAALYAGARQTNTALPNARGFIVDHRVRPESTEEAEWVAEQLRRKCMAAIPRRPIRNLTRRS
jgi:tRNA(Ile)-lysidine synthase TilS/MesJ